MMTTVSLLRRAFSVACRRTGGPGGHVGKRAWWIQANLSDIAARHSMLLVGVGWRRWAGVACGNVSFVLTCLYAVGLQVVYP